MHCSAAMRTDAHRRLTCCRRVFVVFEEDLVAVRLRDPANARWVGLFGLLANEAVERTHDARREERVKLVRHQMTATNDLRDSD